jgi:hypothetical protein
LRCLKGIMCYLLGNRRALVVVLPYHLPDSSLLGVRMEEELQVTLNN